MHLTNSKTRKSTSPVFTNWNHSAHVGRAHSRRRDEKRRASPGFSPATAGRFSLESSHRKKVIAAGRRLARQWDQVPAHLLSCLARLGSPRYSRWWIGCVSLASRVNCIHTRPRCCGYTKFGGGREHFIFGGSSLFSCNGSFGGSFFSPRSVCVYSWLLCVDCGVWNVSGVSLLIRLCVWTWGLIFCEMSGELASSAVGRWNNFTYRCARRECF